uniref:Uncharacterized protein n=1 Tax=Anopheles atroparvus TaxID=41427 RepID=A0AAG5D4T9_ANOAO
MLHAARHVLAASELSRKCLPFAGKVNHAAGCHQEPADLSQFCPVLLRSWQIGPIR